ncbi:MAG: MFS transporter [Treponema sp.]|nr:MFS transporter [Treponema sp.]
MFNIKKQINRLYSSSILGMLSLSGAWVAILASRGFSLAQIGFAETVFHIVCILFEIPSGVVADVFGRKKTLVASCIMRIIAAIVMVFSNNFALVCISIAFNALNYNLSSGSGDALAYDSLKSVGKESLFEKYASNQMILYRSCEGLSTLLAGLSLAVGYRIAYATGVVFGLAQLAVLASLTEVRIEEQKKEMNLWAEIFHCFRQSFLFLKDARKALVLMFSNSLVGALDILLLFFLQAKLPLAGIPVWALGIALLVMQAGGMLGARVILCIKNVRYRIIFAVAASVILLGIAMEHSGLYAVMTLGGFLSALSDDALQIRTNAILQDMFPSEQRATLISIESFTFSVIMIVFSPLAGLFFSWW